MRVSRWLDGCRFPTIVPRDVDQPVTIADWTATFWCLGDIAEAAGRPGPGDLGRLLRVLYALPDPPVDLPATASLGSVPADLDHPGPLRPDQREWLRRR